MAQLKDLVKNGLDETRMLMLGANVVLGFGFRAVFEDRFDQLTPASQWVKLVSLALMTVAVALLMTPVAYHQIVERGECRPDLPPIINRFLAPSLLPFAVALGLDMFVAGRITGGFGVGLAFGGAAAGGALLLWYGLAVRKASPQRVAHNVMDKEPEMAEHGVETRLETKIEHALVELRVVIPGAQALLGFQLACMLTESFARLPQLSRWLHLAALALVAVSIVLLLTPAAYHRLALAGEYTQGFHRLVSRFLIAGMAPLALGITGDFLVVAQLVSGSYALASVLAGALLCLCIGLWFVFTLCCRAAPAQRDAGLPPAAAPASERKAA